MTKPINSNRWRSRAGRVAFIDLFLSALGLLYCGYLMVLTVKLTDRYGYYMTDVITILWARNISATLLQSLALFVAYKLFNTTDDDTGARRGLMYAILYRNINLVLFIVPFFYIFEFLPKCLSDRRQCGGFGIIILTIAVSVFIRSIYLYVVHNYIKELKLLISESTGQFAVCNQNVETGESTENPLLDKDIASQSKHDCMQE